MSRPKSPKNQTPIFMNGEEFDPDSLVDIEIPEPKKLDLKRETISEKSPPKIKNSPNKRTSSNKIPNKNIKIKTLPEVKIHKPKPKNVPDTLEDDFNILLNSNLKAEIIGESPKKEMIPEPPKKEVISEPPKSPKREVIVETPKEEVIPEPPKSPKREVIVEKPKEEVIPKKEVIPEPPKSPKREVIPEKPKEESIPEPSKEEIEKKKKLEQKLKEEEEIKKELGIKKTEEEPIPDFSQWTPEEINKAYEIIKENFDKIKKAFSSYEIPEIDYSKPLSFYYKEYRRYKRHIEICNTSNVFRVGLIFLCGLGHAGMAKMGIDSTDYFKLMMNQIENFEDPLMKLAEMYTIGEGGSPLMKIIKTTGITTVSFLIGAGFVKVLGPVMGKQISEMIMKYIGAKPTPPPPEPTEEEVKKRLEQEKKTKSPEEVFAPLPSVRTLPIDPTSMINTGLNMYTNSQKNKNNKPGRSKPPLYS